MRPLSEKLKELEHYSERYETITFYELRALLGSSLTAFIASLLTLPLLIFSSQWIALPLGFLILLCSIWYFFDEPLWMPDTVKRLQISSPRLRKLAVGIEKLLFRLKLPLSRLSLYDDNLYTFQRLNACLMAFVAFQIGFLESPVTSWWSVLSLLFVSFGAAIDECYLCFAGYALFVLSLL